MFSVTSPDAGWMPRYSSIRARKIAASWTS